MKIRARGNRKSDGRSGLTLLEVTIAMSITATVLLASAGAFSSSLTSVNAAQRVSRGAMFARTVMEDLAAQPYANLTAFNGNTIYDQANASDSKYSINLSVFAASVDLLQVRAILTDLHTGRELCRLTTLRANR